ALWSIRKDGTHLRKLTTFGETRGGEPFLMDASPRGDWIALSARGSSLAIEHLNGSGRRSLIPSDPKRFSIEALDWSPAGKWILYQRTTPTINTTPPTSDL